MLIVFTTTDSKGAADKLAEAAIEAKLAACVQIIPAIESVYEWKGEIMKDTECLLLFKTKESKYSQLEDFIKSTHTYDVPEIVAVKADEISADYSAWITDVLE